MVDLLTVDANLSWHIVRKECVLECVEVVVSSLVRSLFFICSPSCCGRDDDSEYRISGVCEETLTVEKVDDAENVR